MTDLIASSTSMGHEYRCEEMPENVLRKGLE